MARHTIHWAEQNTWDDHHHYFIHYEVCSWNGTAEKNERQQHAAGRPGRPLDRMLMRSNMPITMTTD